MKTPLHFNFIPYTSFSDILIYIYFFCFKSGFLFVPSVRIGKQNKFGLFLSGPKAGSGKSTVSEMLQNMSMDADEIARCRLSHTSTLVGIYKLMDSSLVRFSTKTLVAVP